MVTRATTTRSNVAVEIDDGRIGKKRVSAGWDLSGLDWLDGTSRQMWSHSKVCDRKVSERFAGRCISHNSRNIRVNSVVGGGHLSGRRMCACCLTTQHNTASILVDRACHV